MSNLQFLPPPLSFEGRTIGEVNGHLEEGSTDVIVHDRDQAAYPVIDIDPTKIIRSIGIHLRPSDVFVGYPCQSFWRSIFRTFWSSGILTALLLIHKKTAQTRTSIEGNTVGWDFQRIAKIILVWIKFGTWFTFDRLIALYLSIYPYMGMKPDQLSSLFSTSLNWDREAVKMFKWHPSSSKAAVCLINDDVLIYSRTSPITNSSLTPVLRHPQQKKVTDLVWKPTSPGLHETVLAIGCSNVILVWNLSSFDFKGSSPRVPYSCAHVIDRETCQGFLCPPLTSLARDPTGKWLLFASPTSSNIVMVKESSRDAHLHVRRPLVGDLAGSPSSSSEVVEAEGTVKIIKNWHPFGHGIVRLLLSPDKMRMLVCPAASVIKVLETKNWKERVWKLPVVENTCSSSPTFCQSSCWSGPNGRCLLISVSGDCRVYALAFYDSPSDGNVGGEKGFMQVLDLAEYELPNGQVAGGAIQAMAWDQHSERLVISFRDHPEYLAVFRTSVKPMMVFDPLGFIHGEVGEKAISFDFDPSFSRGSLLSVAWSSGFVSHVPFTYDVTVKKIRQTTSTPTARSLTSMCVSPLKSPLASPITTPLTHRAVGRIIPDITFSSPSPTSTARGVNSGTMLLGSDSVMTPRKAVLFSTRQKDDSQG